MTSSPKHLLVLCLLATSTAATTWKNLDGKLASMVPLETQHAVRDGSSIPIKQTLDALGTVGLHYGLGLLRNVAACLLSDEDAVYDIPYGVDAGQSENKRLDIYKPRTFLPSPVFVFFHGGAWGSGKVESIQSHKCHFNKLRDKSMEFLCN